MIAENKILFDEKTKQMILGLQNTIYQAQNNIKYIIATVLNCTGVNSEEMHILLPDCSGIVKQEVEKKE